MSALGGSRNRLQEIGLLAVVGVLFAVLSWLGYDRAVPGQDNLFLNSDSLVSGVASPMSMFAVMAIGMTCVIITGGIDISVGWIMALSALAGAAALEALPEGAPGWQVILIGVGAPLATGLACGAVNGGLIVGLKLHSFIVTLGTMSIFRGLATVLPAEATLPTHGKSLPVVFGEVMRWKMAGLEFMPLLIMVAVLIAGAIYLSLLVWGRETYAVGGNLEAARFSGIRTGRTIFRVYLISGLCGGIAGLINLGRFGTASSDSNKGYELTVVAAAVVGGASLSGGRGTALGAFLGAMILALLEFGILTFSSNREYKQIIIGAAIIVAVSIERLLRRQRT